jgi:3-hexulose-6-phosphate synthase
VRVRDGGRPQLQLAIDAPEHLALIPLLADLFDLIEVGTPVLKRFGLSAITTAKELGRGTHILADTKTADGGALEARMVCEAGASMMTVLAHASPATREVAREVAAEYGADVIFDTILDGAFDPTPLLEGSDAEVWLALHSPSDSRLAGVEDSAHIDRISLRQDAGCRVSLAGGIGRANIEQVLQTPPDIIVIGSSVTGAADPLKEAQWLTKAVEQMRG